MAAEKCPVKRFALASLFHCSNCYKMQCFNEKFKLSIPTLSFLICCVWVCRGCLWEVILLKFLLKHAFCSFVIAAFYLIWSYMSLLTVQLMKFACCINKSALLCSFCILTDNLMIVKHHTDFVYTRMMLICHLFYCQGYIWQSWSTMFVLFFKKMFSFFFFFYSIVYIAAVHMQACTHPWSSRVPSSWDHSCTGQCLG